MPTTITSSIGSGRTYSTIQAWLDAAPDNLVAADQVWKGELYNDFEFTDEANVSGFTTDATRYVWLTVAAGHSFQDHADKLTNPLRYDQTKGVGWRKTGGYGTFIRGSATNNSASAFTRIDRIQFHYDSSFGSNYYYGIFLGNGGVIADCLYQSNRSGGRNIAIENATARNLVIIQRQPTSGSLLELGNTSSARYITVIQPDDIAASAHAIRQAYGSNLVIRNCAVFGNFTNPFPTTNIDAANSGYNATNAAAAPGPNNQLNLTAANQFENTATFATLDARVKTGSALINAGTPVSGITTDVNGTTRSATTPTIGAYEVAGAATPPATINLVGSNASQNATSGTGAVTVSGGSTPATINLVGSNASQSANSGTGAVTVVPAPKTINLVGANCTQTAASGYAPEPAPEAIYYGGGNYDFLNPRRKKSEEEVERVIEAIAEVAQPIAEAKRELKQALQARDIEYKAEYAKALTRIREEVQRKEWERQDEEDIEFLLLA